jgi:probable rRNA maturation factor
MRTSRYTIHTNVRRAYRALVPLKRLKAAIQHTLTAHAVRAGSALSLIVADDETVQQLNREYRGVDAPTDILSFPHEPFSEAMQEAMLAAAASAGASGQGIAAELQPYLGDLIIALPYTQRCAAELGRPLEDELVLLVVHGTLHLLGYDHDTAEAQARMWQKQAELLAQLGIAELNIPHFTSGDSHEDSTDGD